MNFKKMLQAMNQEKFIKAMNDYHVKIEEQQQYFRFINELLTLKPIDSTGRLIMEEYNEQLSIAVQIQGKTYAIDFVPWEEVLGYDVGDTITEEFAFLVLFDMSYDGFDKKLREQKIDKL